MLRPSLDTANGVTRRSNDARGRLERLADFNAVQRGGILALYPRVELHQFIIEQIPSCRLQATSLKILYLRVPSFQYPSCTT